MFTQSLARKILRVLLHVFSSLFYLSSSPSSCRFVSATALLVPLETVEEELTGDGVWKWWVSLVLTWGSEQIAFIFYSPSCTFSNPMDEDTCHFCGGGRVAWKEWNDEMMIWWNDEMQCERGRGREKRGFGSVSAHENIGIKGHREREPIYINRISLNSDIFIYSEIRRSSLWVFASRITVTVTVL